MIELKDFITTLTTNTNNYILSEVSKGVLKYSIGIAVDVNEEKCKKWIKQAIEIETFSKEQIEDLKIRHLFDKKDTEIEKLRKRVYELEQQVEDLQKE